MDFVQASVTKLMGSFAIGTTAYIANSVQTSLSPAENWLERFGFPVVMCGAACYAIKVVFSLYQKASEGRLEDSKEYGKALTEHLKNSLATHEELLVVTKEWRDLSGEQIKAQAKNAAAVVDLTEAIKHCTKTQKSGS